jgi:isopenicillin N synthase-like dioxygenase
MQPYHKATPGQLQTFELPQEVTVNEENSNIRKALIEAWRKDGILQIRMTLEQSDTLRQCFKTSKEFSSLPAEEKATYVDD